MELTIHVDPAERTVRFREVHALAAGDSCSVVLEGVRGADVAALRLALYRDAASKSPVASCPSFAPVRGHPDLAAGTLRLDTAEMAAWFEAAVPAAAQAESGPGRSRPEDAAERAVRTDGWLVVSDPGRTWAACRVPVVLRPGAGISDVVDPTSLQALVEGLVSAAMSGALASKADKATTLAGYGITDAATKSELDSVNRNVANAISGVQSELSTKADLVDGKVPVAQLPSLALGETPDTAYPGDKGAANASGIAALKKSKQDALDAKQLSAVNSGITAEKISNMVTKDGVVPKGSGTEVIATIGGKDIKAPASPVSSVNGKKGVVKLVAKDVGALALESANKVGSSFSMDFEGEETSGGNILFGVGMGPAGRTFIANKLYCSDRLYANGFVITNTSGAPGESVLARIQEYGGDYKTALDEVNSLVGEAMKGATTEEYVDGMAKYPVVQKSGAIVMLEDRKVNVYSGTLSSDVTLVLPAANSDGRVRDLEFRAEVSGLRLVGVRRTDASGAAVALFSMSPESVPAEEGVNAWYFTETGGEVRVERAVLKPAGFQVKMDFTCTSNTGVSNDVDFLDSAGETIKSIKFKNQTLSEIVSGVSSLRISMSEYGHIVMNGSTYYKTSPELLSAIPLTGDSVITASSAEYCLAPDTPILSPSGLVALKDVRVGDAVIGVDADGRVCTTTVTRCDTDMEKWADSCDRWTFVRENGDTVVVTTVMRHRFYNVERGEMTYMDEWNVGEHGRDYDGRFLELVSHEHVDGPVRHMTLFTETQTYFAGGLLSGNRHTPHIDWEDR